MRSKVGVIITMRSKVKVVAGLTPIRENYVLNSFSHV